jgi:hypothetical protein
VEVGVALPVEVDSSRRIEPPATGFVATTYTLIVTGGPIGSEGGVGFPRTDAPAVPLQLVIAAIPTAMPVAMLNRDLTLFPRTFLAKTPQLGALVHSG